MPFNCATGLRLSETLNLAANDRPAITRLYRMQWEEAQQRYVLLFPEGLVQLNGSAAEILKRCDGTRSFAQIVTELELAFQATALSADVEVFLKKATAIGWITWQKEALQ
jgi:pyrroloquinoline quinone biosynthesis protein D